MFECHRLEEIEMDTTSQSTATRSRELVRYDPTQATTSTPAASQNDHQQQDEQFEMLTNPEQLEELLWLRERESKLNFTRQAKAALMMRMVLFMRQFAIRMILESHIFIHSIFLYYVRPIHHQSALSMSAP